MDLRGRTVGSSNPNEVNNPVTLLKGLDDVPKRSVKPKGSQEPLLTETPSEYPPSGETKAQRSQRKINEAMEIAKNNNASDIELIRTYRKATAEAEAEDSPINTQQVITTSSAMVGQTMDASQSSLEEGQIRETSTTIIENMVNRMETNDLNPLPEVGLSGVEERREQSNSIPTLETTINDTVEQGNPLLYPHSSKDTAFMDSLIPEKRNALLTAERVIGKTIREVEMGQRPLTSLTVAQHTANIIDHAHNFNVEAIVRDAMVRNQVPIDGRLHLKQASSSALVPVVQQKGGESVLIGSPKVNREGRRNPEMDSILPKDIFEYLKDFNDTFPLLIEPTADFKVMEGQIPPPMERGSVERRMRLMSPPNRRPSMVEWTTVEFQQLLLNQDLKDLIYEINLVCQEMRTIGHTLPCPDYARTLSDALHSWATLIARKSPLIQAMVACHRDIFFVCSRVNDLVDYTKEKYASRGNGITKPVYPEIVIITDDNARTMLYLMESILDQMAGSNHDKLDWARGQSNILWQSDNFKRLLYNSYAEWMKKDRQVTMETMYPWFARYTENIMHLPKYVMHLPKKIFTCKHLTSG